MAHEQGRIILLCLGEFECQIVDLGILSFFLSTDKSNSIQTTDLKVQIQLLHMPNDFQVLCELFRASILLQ